MLIVFCNHWQLVASVRYWSAIIKVYGPSLYMLVTKKSVHILVAFLLMIIIHLILFSSHCNVCYLIQHVVTVSFDSSRRITHNGYVSTNAAAGIILCMRPANERRRYNVTSSHIVWERAQHDPCSSSANPFAPHHIYSVACTHNVKFGSILVLLGKMLMQMTA